LTGLAKGAWICGRGFLRNNGDLKNPAFRSLYPKNIDLAAIVKFLLQATLVNPSLNTETWMAQL